MVTEGIGSMVVGRFYGSSVSELVFTTLSTVDIMCVLKPPATPEEVFAGFFWNI